MSGKKAGPQGKRLTHRTASAPTVIDVAQAAGVSPQTVSNALNQPDKVKKTTLERVKRAIEQVGYRPSYAAQALRGGTSRTVALVTLGEDEARHFDRPYFGRVLNGVLTAAERQGYKTLIHHAEPHRLDELLSLFDQGRVDGAVVAAGVAHSRDLRRLHESGHPVALVDRRSTKLPCAHVDYQAAMTEIVEHMALEGRKRLLYLSGRVGRERGTTPLARLLGFEETTQRLGIDKTSLVMSCDWTAASGRNATKQAIGERRKLDGILCASDDIALGALAALRGEPSLLDRVRVTGFDASYPSEVSEPPFSTVAVPFETLAEEATNRLLDQIIGRKSGVGREYRGATQFLQRTK